MSVPDNVLKILEILELIAPYYATISDELKKLGTTGQTSSVIAPAVVSAVQQAASTVSTAATTAFSSMATNVSGMTTEQQTLNSQLGAYMSQGMSALQAAEQVLNDQGTHFSRSADLEAAANALLLNAGYTFMDASTTMINQLSTGINNTLGAASGVMQAAMGTVVAATQVVVAAAGGVAPALINLPAIAPIAAPTFTGVGALNSTGGIVGAPGAASPWVSGQAPINVTVPITVQGSVVGVPQLIQTVGQGIVQALRQAGMKN